MYGPVLVVAQVLREAAAGEVHAAHLQTVSYQRQMEAAVGEVEADLWADSGPAEAGWELVGVLLRHRE